ncbi:MAG: antibiotic ABC transporter permease [Anaerolinea sp.]|nr:antibiotic ABC transporter permease [Anaerolinea sp.]
MNPRIALATAARVLTQLRRDPRTLLLLLLVPVVLEALMKGIFWDQPGVFQRVGVPLLGIFPMTSMFLVTSITMLRERTSGTLERLMTMPLAKLDLLLGYALAFGAVATLQGTLVSLFAFGLLDLNVAGSPAAVVALAVLNALLGTAFGLLVSAFATTEFQAVQFMPAFLFPQLLLSGLMVPRERMLSGLEVFSNFLPMTYAYDALYRVSSSASFSGALAKDVAILVGATLGALILGAATLRRRSG